MAVTKRREAERAVVRCALEARDAIYHSTLVAADRVRMAYEEGWIDDEEGRKLSATAEQWGALLHAVTTLRNLPTLAIDQPRPAVRDDATHTSRLAARRIAPKQGSKRRVIYDQIALRSYGMTDGELEALTRWPHQTVSAARNSLVENGWLYDSGERRTINGSRLGIVWMARPEETL